MGWLLVGDVDCRPRRHDPHTDSVYHPIHSIINAKSRFETNIESTSRVNLNESRKGWNTVFSRILLVLLVCDCLLHCSYSSLKFDQGCYWHE